MAAMNVPGFGDQLWANGPSPGAFYNFPGNQNGSKTAEQISPAKRTMYPTTTGTSVLGLKFDGGVLMAADTLGSYGSLARFREVSRLMAVGNNTIVGGSGDYADFQYLKSVLEQKVIDDACLNDGHGYTPKSIYSWLTRVMYYRRTRFDPLWIQIVVGGVHNGESFLGCVDKIGVAFEAPTISTGFGAYLAQPILRDAFEKNPTMTLDQARQVIVNCLRVLFYRDARSLNKFEVAVITKDGVVIEPATSADTNWEIAPMVKRKQEAENSVGELRQTLRANLEVLILAFDLEVYEHDHGIILEIGYAMTTLHNSEEIETFHYIIEENLRYENKDYVPDNRYRFKFGTSRRMSLGEATKKLQEHIDAADFLVTHSGAHDTEFLANCGVSVSGKPMFDTQILAKALLPDGPQTYSLKRLLADLEISFDEDILHNGGNDAYHTMEVFLAQKIMAVKAGK